MPERYHIGMKIKESGVALSHIVEIGENLAALSARTGAEYLRLNRGINSVVNIDLREVIAGIDFNTAQMQTYPPGRGRDLRMRFRRARRAHHDQGAPGGSQAAGYR